MLTPVGPRATSRHAVVLALALTGLALLEAPAGAQVPSLNERLRAALAAAQVVGAESPSLVTVTADEEGLAVLRAVTSATGGAPERHLAASIVRVPSAPRAPGAVRQTTLGLMAQPAASDVDASPVLRVALAAGALEIGGSQGPPGADFLGATPGPEVDRFVAPRSQQVSARLAGALALVQQTLRVELERAGQPCSTAASILPDSPFERAFLEVESRCGAQPTTRVTLLLDNFQFDAAQRLVGARLQRTAGSPAPGDVGQVLFVPVLLRGQLWDDATPGVVAYGLGQSGSVPVDFAALLEGGQTPDCVSDATTLCLDDQPNDGRFRVTLAWFTAIGGGQSGQAFASPLSGVGLPDGGLFSFFEGNPEFLVKVLDGCSINGHFWLFGAPTTTLGFRLEVEDLVAKAAGRPSPEYLRVIDNVDGVTAPSFSLLEAFPGCDL
ncbi:MAG: hypothetical protein DWQ36_09180 [Acidobacteria bacterium]|nr:MAG: hypothetical protein DWQ30_22425 [Acidobacteriota bacterium]REK08532.1 MAG: hypothetical protein DWQ36_09180 [Acidobacteriota bacterium]